jgi:hypothetical protein
MADGWGSLGFGMPMDARPDPLGRTDELGRPLMVGVGGRVYTLPGPAAPEAPQAPTGPTDIWGNPIAAFAPAPTPDMVTPYAEGRATGQGAVGSILPDGVNALAQAAWSGIAAPAAAWRGDPLTLTDVYATAGAAASGGTLGAVPENALGSLALNRLPMYHGSPDARALRAAGQFEPRTTTVSVRDPQTGEIARETVPSPTFFSTDRRTASSYADPHRAWDYQNAEPAVVAASTSPTRVLDVDGGGQRFRGIDRQSVRAGLIAAGTPEAEADAVIARVFNGGRPDRMSTDDLSYVAHQLGFDAVDVANVVDDYMGRAKPTTVRMMMRPDQIALRAAALAAAGSGLMSQPESNALAGWLGGT